MLYSLMSAPAFVCLTIFFNKVKVFDHQLSHRGEGVQFFLQLLILAFILKLKIHTTSQFLQN